MWNARLDEAQAGITIARRNINNLNNLRYVDATTLLAEREEELTLMKKIGQHTFHKVQLKF